MKKITFLTFIFLFLASFNYAQEGKEKTVFGRPVKNISPTGHIRCATDEYEEFLQKSNPKRMTTAQFENWLKPLMEKQEQFDMLSSESGGIIYIPVVVHVIHNGDALGVNENITDAQVQSQITVMTQDFRRMLGTPGYNTNSVGADIQIEFVLAKVDPNGNPTNGINRVNLCQASWSTGDINSIVKPTTIWDPTLYMNMWSVNFTDASLLGYAQFPSGSGLIGMPASGGDANTDGVVAGYRFFGSSSLASGNFQAPYDKGRTMTHEVGHFVGLLHTFQGGCAPFNNNTAGDYCSDTPSISAPNFGCPTGTDSCPSTIGLDMLENYMDYTDDTCMNIFTAVQKTRITTVMNNSPRRLSLKTSTKDLAIPLFANDAEVLIENSCAGVATCAVPNPPTGAKIVSLYNRGTGTLTSAVLSYNINGGTTYTNNWTGSLAPNSFAYITLANTAVNGTLNITITSVNGGTDQRASNNSASKVFGGGASSIPNHDFTNFTFNLTGDRYGSETTWNLKNASGTTLYSGGPYSDIATNTTQPLVTNQAWTLPASGCYTFTINDSYGDGISSALYGAGSYTITTNGGSTTVASGGVFGSTESKLFTNNALTNESFNVLNDIYLFPNPAKSLVNISISGNELPENLTIYNNIGQLVLSKKVSNVDDLTINTSSYSTGIYFVKVVKGSDSKTLRFIKE